LEHLEHDGRQYTKVEFSLETGRKNQIRVHSQWIGHPVAGDKKYDAQTNPIGRLALHAKAISFIHPWTGKTMRFTADTPRSFRL
jgi:23S rRNA pseudouridine1911/1915/1917 synthase